LSGGVGEGSADRASVCPAAKRADMRSVAVSMTSNNVAASLGNVNGARQDCLLTEPWLSTEWPGARHRGDPRDRGLRHHETVVAPFIAAMYTSPAIR